jgi:hypothetical protein
MNLCRGQRRTPAVESLQGCCSFIGQGFDAVGRVKSSPSGTNLTPGNWKEAQQSRWIPGNSIKCDGNIHREVSFRQGTRDTLSGDLTSQVLRPDWEFRKI